MSWRCLQDVFARRLENVLKISSRRLEEVFARRLEDVLKTSWRRYSKTSWRRLESVFKTSWNFLKTSWNFLKTTWRSMDKTNILVLTKTSSEDVWLIRRYLSSSRCLEDVFIKTNVHWVWTFFLYTDIGKDTSSFLSHFRSVANIQTFIYLIFLIAVIYPALEFVLDWILSTYKLLI